MANKPKGEPNPERRCGHGPKKKKYRPNIDVWFGGRAKKQAAAAEAKRRAEEEKARRKNEPNFKWVKIWQQRKRSMPRVVQGIILSHGGFESMEIGTPLLVRLRCNDDLVLDVVFTEDAIELELIDHDVVCDIRPGVRRILWRNIVKWSDPQKKAGFPGWKTGKHRGRPAINMSPSAVRARERYARTRAIFLERKAALGRANGTLPPEIIVKGPDNAVEGHQEG